MNPKYWWRVIQVNLHPSKPLKGQPTFYQSLRAVIFASWLNVLMIFIPISWAVHYALNGDSKTGSLVQFLTAFIAIVPLAKLTGYATEEVALRMGQTLGGLLNATFGNAVELIVSIVALLQCELRIVQSSLVGSILSNLLLVLGMCFFAGGTQFSEQGFGAAASQLNSSLLVVSVIAVLLPAAFHLAVSSGAQDANESTTAFDPDQGEDILRISRGVAVILLVTYVAYLIFQLWSHAQLYEDDSDDNFKSTRFASSSGENTNTRAAPAPQKDVGISSGYNQHENGSVPEKDRMSINPPPGSSSSDHVQQERDIERAEPQGEDDGEEQEEPQMSLWMAILTLLVVTVLVAVTAEFLVGSINNFVKFYPISKEWVALIMLPIVGNAAEHVTAVTVSVKDKLNLSLGVAAGSSIQIALFVIPFIVVLAWWIGKPLTLLFDPFESVTLFLAVITVNYVTADGKSNWLEGLILMNLYFIVGVSFWYYPGSDPSGELNMCQT